MPNTRLRPDPAAEMPVQPRSRFRDILADPARLATVAELVPWRGDMADSSGARARELLDDLVANPRIDALSLTDSAGGHPMLSPEVVARSVAARGGDAIVHVACRDRNRNELLSLAWRLASDGIDNVLALSGDYPVEGFGGVARPVFDLDSVALLDLYAGLNDGFVGDAIVGRAIARDSARSMAALAPAHAGRGRSSSRPDFFLGAAINPFKRRESEQLPQYLKLVMKARAGARYAISQVGFDIRKLDELLRFVAESQLPLGLLANVYVLSGTVARIFASGAIPGVLLPPALLERAELEVRSPDKGKAFFIDLAARQIAIARGLGYAGVYLSGPSRAADFAAVLDAATGYAGGDWRELIAATDYPYPGTFYLYQRPDPSAAPALNGPARARLGRPPRVPLAYRFSRLLHHAVFAPDSRGFGVAGRAYASFERAHLGHLLHVAEQAIKGPLFDCQDCGDCSLPEIAYLCPESQCVKNQRNGPCGGSRDGDCEVPGRTCIWVRAYDRLQAFGEASTMLDRPIALPDNALRRTSAWANTFLARDHVTRPSLVATLDRGTAKRTPD